MGGEGKLIVKLNSKTWMNLKTGAWRFVSVLLSPFFVSDTRQIKAKLIESEKEFLRKFFLSIKINRSFICKVIGKWGDCGWKWIWEFLVMSHLIWLSKMQGRPLWFLSLRFPADSPRLEYLVSSISARCSFFFGARPSSLSRSPCNEILNVRNYAVALHEVHETSDKRNRPEKQLSEQSYHDEPSYKISTMCKYWLRTYLFFFSHGWLSPPLLAKKVPWYGLRERKK